MQKRFVIVFAMMLMSAAGFAQLGGGNVFVGYSFNHASTGYSPFGPPTSPGNLNGWEASVEGHFLPFIGLVGDFGAQYGDLNISGANFQASTTVTTYLFGPRASVKVGPIRPFAEALIGVGHLHESTPLTVDTDNSFSDALGGGFDYSLLPHIGWRLQADALQTRFRGLHQNNTRISTGVVFRF